MDASRLMAALAVVLFHWCGNGIANGKVTSIQPFWFTPITKYGYLGVPCFFLISGFVIVLSAQRKTPGAFLAARAQRLFPLFWVCLATTSVVALVAKQPNLTVQPVQILANATMLARALGSTFVDGAYWTLEFEWLFYAIVFIILCLSTAHRIERVLVIWAVCIILGDLAGLGDTGIGYYVFSPNCLTFVAGAVAGTACTKGWTKGRAVVFAGISSAVLAYECSLGLARNGMLGAVAAGAVLSLYLAMAVGSTTPLGTLRIPGSGIAGKLTYPVYLLHAHLGYMTLNRFATDANKYWLVGLMLIALILLAWAYQYVVEERLQRGWRTLFQTLIRRPIDALTQGRGVARGDAPS